LRDLLGRTLGSWQFNRNTPFELQTDASKGMYWIEISGEGNKGGVRILKE